MQDKEAAAAAMLEWVDACVLPVKYGGTNALPLAEWAPEVELAAYVAGLGTGGEADIACALQPV